MDEFNPYAPPIAEHGSPDMPGAGEPLFIDRHVAGATFLGGPVAGFILVGINEQRMGNEGELAKMTAWGVLASLATFVIGWVLPPEVPGMGLTIGYVIGMLKLAQHWQGDRVMYRLSQGTPKASGWIAAGVGLACLVVVVLILLVFILNDPSLMPS